MTIKERPGRPAKIREVRKVVGLGAGANYQVHNASHANIMRGITERVLYVPTRDGLRKPPKPVAGVFERLGRIRSRIIDCLLPTTIVPRADYPGLYNGRKRMIYERAVESLSRRPLRNSDAIVNTFVKAEKVNFSAKPDPAPRVIQPRSARYNVEVGRRLKLFECNLVGSFERAFGYPVIVKGMNAARVAGTMLEHWERYRQPVGFGLDASRFDQHVSRDALEWEHSVYLAAFPGDKQLASLLKHQLRNRCKAYLGDRVYSYETDGCRMSGDMNTGMGNCLIMSSIVLAYADKHGIDCRLVNNGDDCVVICSAADEGRFDGLSEWFLEFGFTLTREATTRVFEQLEFCQARPCLTDSGWRMVRNPLTAIDKDCVSLLPWDRASDFASWRAAIGGCGLQLTAGVPVWSAFYKLLSDGVETTRAREMVRDSGLGRMAAGMDCSADITDEARASFYYAYGITPDMQVELELEYASAICRFTRQVFADTTESSLKQWQSASVPASASPA